MILENDDVDVAEASGDGILSLRTLSGSGLICGEIDSHDLVEGVGETTSRGSVLELAEGRGEIKSRGSIRECLELEEGEGESRS